MKTPARFAHIDILHVCVYVRKTDKSRTIPVFWLNSSSGLIYWEKRVRQEESSLCFYNLYLDSRDPCSDAK